MILVIYSNLGADDDGESLGVSVIIFLLVFVFVFIFSLRKVGNKILTKIFVAVLVEVNLLRRYSTLDAAVFGCKNKF